MTTRITEIWVGVFVAAGLAALFVLAMKVSNLNTLNQEDGFLVEARFEDVSGLKVRSAVTMAGVRIGRVVDIEFDKLHLNALVRMRINKDYDTLPADTAANIYTAGLLGEKYVGLEPGAGADECEELMLEAELEGRSLDPVAMTECKEKGKATVLANGSRIKRTQDSLVLEKLLQRFITQFIDKSSDAAAP